MTNNAKQYHTHPQKTQYKAHSENLSEYTETGETNLIRLHSKFN